MMNCAAFSQQTDTIHVSKSDLVRKLKQLEDCKVITLEAEQLRQQNYEQSILLAVKDVRIDNYEMQAFNYTRQIRLKDEVIGALNKSLKAQKRKTLLAIIGGGLLTSLFIFK
jgi:hypothetical protein